MGDSGWRASIDDRLMAAIGRMGWDEPTEIQRACLDPALEDKDVIALAETG